LDSEDESDLDDSFGEVSGEENDEDFENRSNSISKDKMKDTKVIIQQKRISALLSFYNSTKKCVRKN
jgi:hypothetical protein